MNYPLIALRKQAQDNARNSSPLNSLRFTSILSPRQSITPTSKKSKERA